MLATYQLPNLDLSQPLSSSMSNNYCCFDVKPSHSNAPHSAMVGDYSQQVGGRLAGAYQFFQVDKAMTKQQQEQHYIDPSNHSFSPSSSSKTENPLGGMTTPCTSSPNVLSLPKDIRFVLLAEEDEEEYETEVDEDYMDINEEDDYEDEEDDEDSGEKWNQQPESPSKLLAFASGVTNDLQSYFARNKNNDDFCEVFENKYKLIKSGRELYYADLLMVAQYGDGNGKGKTSKEKPLASKSAKMVKQTATTHTITASNGRLTPCLLPHRGTLNSELGLGPYQELFDSVLREPLIVKDEFHSMSAHVEFAPHMMRYNTSWSGRKFPPSFWDEPGAGMQKDLVPSATNQTVDFSDLLAGW